MKAFDANITLSVMFLLDKNLKDIDNVSVANNRLFGLSGIKNFFTDSDELTELKESLTEKSFNVEEPDRTEYGDFQTNRELVKSIANLLTRKSVNPTVVVEPTFGKGSFIIAALDAFSTIRYIYGIEIYKPYIWETKFSILDYYLDHPQQHKPEIMLNHFNIYDFDFKTIAKKHSSEEFLIIGNPPWVTNAKLGSLDSENLPVKSNFKNHSGYDAITGKGNFDIGEYIAMMMFDAFQNVSGHFAFLVKNSVIKNIISGQRERKYKISFLEKYSIDSKKEFNAAVESALFFCKLNSDPAFECREYDFYSGASFNSYGWVDNKFVSNSEHYAHYSLVDGVCPFEWRQGVKNDCSEVMELERKGDIFINGFNEEVFIEEDLVYGILKSSDLKNSVTDQSRKFTIVTQQKIGQETNYIKTKYPLTYKYLFQYKEIFENRKSSIYKGKPSFSIFGIGDYSFKPYKVAISGLYKKYSFNLVLPNAGKPLMLDDTCYFIGFNNIEYAVYTHILLNSEIAIEFLKSVTFLDAKRTFTKDVLMRIDLLKIAQEYDENKISALLDEMNEKFNFNVEAHGWNKYIKAMTPVNSEQLEILL